MAVPALGKLPYRSPQNEWDMLLDSVSPAELQPKAWGLSGARTCPVLENLFGGLEEGKGKGERVLISGKELGDQRKEVDLPSLGPVAAPGLVFFSLKAVPAVECQQCCS